MNSKCFTMIEMVVVIVIIATLAAVATPMYFNYVKSSRAGAAKMQIGIFEQCIFDYRVHMKKLPASLEDLVKNNSGSKRWKGPYLKGGVIPQDPWGNDYIYKKPGDHGEFDIISYGADGQPGGAEDEKIADTLKNAKTLALAGDALLTLALEGGGRDNITVALFTRGAEEEA